MTDPTSSAFGIIWAEPSDGGELNIVTVSPGLPGFIAMFLLAAVVVLLAIDMTRRIRRLQARERVAERHRLEEEAAQAEHDVAAESDGEEPGTAKPGEVPDHEPGEVPDHEGPGGEVDLEADGGRAGHHGDDGDAAPGHPGDRRD
ncbi:hypothetical protein [Brachybacterium phenoliresistens]|uniref:Uncharacterized protein n=1 Tax=Brachybacterium phenoliresistens TaxID=396014 RepID=Z9JXB5_9MICO|nr:hypothetical protein [Brachybacterium phenoliresistens]EWS82441.1 hypothetical protein BF93_10790 [Brachybacterium phenoliresistens]